MSGVFIFNSLYAKQIKPSRQDEWRRFINVINIIEKNYVDKLEFNEILKKSLEGLLNNLDAHSGYLKPTAFSDMNIKTKGEFGGLGITVGIRDGALTVIAPMEGTPADKAGIKAGDIILKINNKSSLGMDINEAVGIMRGKVGSPINLTIVRKNVSKPIKVKIVRGVIKIKSVYHKRYKNLLYLRVVSFDKNVERSLRKAIKSAKKWSKGIVLDLRNNPGGLLDQAIKTTNLFVGSGLIVSQKGRNKNDQTKHRARSSWKETDLPLVVLVNAGSASASEIVSGALQDHKRGIIIGEKTFGKGSVQVILPLDKKDAIRLTVARYYLPSGRTIQAKGITPDIEVHQGKLEEIEDNFSIKEAELKDHLEAKLNEVNKKTKKNKKKTKNKDVLITQEQTKNDLQLRSALNILQALILSRK